MKVIQAPAVHASSLEQLKTRVVSYLSQQIKPGNIIDPEVKKAATEIAEKLFVGINKEFAITAMVKGLCVRTMSAHANLQLPYEVYLHAAATILGYGSWQALSKEATQDDLVVNHYHGRFSGKKPADDPETSIPYAKGLASLAKGTMVTWAALHRIMYKLSSPSLHPHIDTLLMEMQVAVGITAATDPRGDMLFAIFRDPNMEDCFIIFGEKYRPPQEKEGTYKTVMVRVKTYPMTNRIESISSPRGDCYSPITIKQMVDMYRAVRHGFTV